MAKRKGKARRKATGRPARKPSRKTAKARAGRSVRSARTRPAGKAKARSRTRKARTRKRITQSRAVRKPRVAASRGIDRLGAAADVVEYVVSELVDRTLTPQEEEALAYARATTPPTFQVAGVEIKAPLRPRYGEILSHAALTFLADLHRSFDERRRELLAARAAQQARYDAGELPDFRADTAHIRERDWTIAPIPADLQDRRVEITGPVDRKMIINALNSGANVFMADFEDANSPTWDNNLEGQINLKDRWAGRVAFTDEETGKHYRLIHKPAVLIVRPRGWHLLEEHLTVDDEPIAGALFDFGLYLFHNHKALAAKKTGPYFYLPKLETHEEARLWNDVFVHAQDELGIPRGTIKATVLIETLPAAFEMDEILWELREHITGLNAGRWDYIFSFIKKFARNPDYILPDRNQVVMGKAFLGAYADLLVKTCHRRHAFAMGGMAAQIPVKGDRKANEEAFAKVRADKEREVRQGHDGTWVAHPALVPVAKEVFDRLMPQPNQLGNKREDVRVTRDDLLRIHEGTKTEAGFRLNIRVGVQYIEAWLRGRGAVPIYNLMEDAATAEISRAQIWQWLKYGAVLDTGITVTAEFFDRALAEEMQVVRREVGEDAYRTGRFRDAVKLFRDISLAEDFAEFLTIPAYRLII